MKRVLNLDGFIFIFVSLSRCVGHSTPRLDQDYRQKDHSVHRTFYAVDCNRSIDESSSRKKAFGVDVSGSRFVVPSHKLLEISHQVGWFRVWNMSLHCKRTNCGLSSTLSLLLPSFALEQRRGRRPTKSGADCIAWWPHHDDLSSRGQAKVDLVLTMRRSSID